MEGSKGCTAQSRSTRVLMHLQHGSDLQTFIAYSVAVLRQLKAIALADAHHDTDSEGIRIQVMLRLRHERGRVPRLIVVQLRPRHRVCHSGDTGRGESIWQRLVERDEQTLVAAAAPIGEIPLQLRKPTSNSTEDICKHSTALNKQLQACWHAAVKA